MKFIKGLDSIKQHALGKPANQLFKLILFCKKKEPSLNSPEALSQSAIARNNNLPFL